MGAIRDGGTQAGYVRVFQWSGSAWVQMGTDINAESTGDELGFSVALSADGTRLAVGARRNNGAENLAGHVRVFQWSGSAWQQLGTDVHGDAPYEQSGYSVSLSDDGSRLAVGAPGGSSNRGLVRAYEWSGSERSQLGTAISGEATSDTAGWSVALSADGSRFAVGTSGAGPGLARVFVWSGSAWVQVGENIDGEAVDDQSGTSVALAADGAAVAVGATRNDGAGHVRVHGSLTPTPVPGPPSGVAGVAGDSQVTVSWSAPLSDGGSPITAYTVTAAPGGDTCSTSGALTCTVTDLVNGTGYTFTVTATNADGTSPASAPSGWLTPATLPDAPSGTAASVSGDAEAVVWWSAPAFDGGSPITAYTVTAAPGGDTCSSSGALSCTVTGLTIGTAYTFVVTATNGVGSGPASAASDPLEATAAPGAPSGVVATAGDSHASVTWTPPTANGGSPITGSTVTASPGGQTCTTSGALSYTFTATANNDVGTGPASPASDPATPTTTPGAPTNVIATAGNSHASITWTAPTSNGGSAIAGYTVTATPGGRTCTTTSALTCTVTGLANGTAHTFTVTATNDVGTSPASPPSDPVTPTTTGGVASVVPDPPSDVEATPGDSEDSVSWTAPDTNGSSPITGYTVTASPRSATCSTSGALSCTVTGLTNGVTYSFTVIVTISEGASTASPESDAVTPEATTSHEGGLAHLPPCPSPQLPFLDIDSVISRADVACIRGLGITTGTSPTTYNPDGHVDRDQMATFLARLWRALGDA